MSPGGKLHYSDLAIRLVLIPRMVFHLPLRQTHSLRVGTARTEGMATFLVNHWISKTK